MFQVKCRHNCLTLYASYVLYIHYQYVYKQCNFTDNQQGCKPARAKASDWHDGIHQRNGPSGMHYAFVQLADFYTLTCKDAIQCIHTIPYEGYEASHPKFINPILYTVSHRTLFLRRLRVIIQACYNCFISVCLIALLIDSSMEACYKTLLVLSLRISGGLYITPLGNFPVKAWSQWHDDNRSANSAKHTLRLDYYMCEPQYCGMKKELSFSFEVVTQLLCWGNCG